MRILIAAKNAVVAVEDGRIVTPEGRFEAVIQVPGGEVRPGLINAHDHLHRNHYGRLGDPPYRNAYEWARDIQTRHVDVIAHGRSLLRRDALLIGAWKNLLSGVTHVVHHDVWETDFDADFPLNVVRIANADSLGMSYDFEVPKDAPFALHVAEGIDRVAVAEVHTLAARGLLNRNLITVHAVGADEDGVARMRASGCAMVWCPTSNHFLFGRTAPRALLADGMDVLIGSDSLLTGAGTLLDELRIARGMISDCRILDAVGAVAARRLGIAESSLTPGAPADLVLFRGPFLGAGIEDVVLVIAKGRLRVLDPDLVPALGITGGHMTTWRGVTRWTSSATAL
jgi:cytosine/adenosine deaminase-related metal-dependent hydrolase